MLFQIQSTQGHLKHRKPQLPPFERKSVLIMLILFFRIKAQLRSTYHSAIWQPQVINHLTQVLLLRAAIKMLRARYKTATRILTIELSSIKDKHIPLPFFVHLYQHIPWGQSHFCYIYGSVYLK
ncbi:hypothetical protein VPH35_066328 [Triticum aestivum]